MVARMKALQLDYDELSKVNVDLEQTVRRLGIKKYEVKEVVKVEVREVRDTIIMKEQDNGCFSYSDQWLNIEVCEDTITHLTNDVKLDVLITERRKKKFLFWRYGKKERSVYVNSDNPYLNITDLNYVIPD
jgi:hypothetical protein